MDFGLIVCNMENVNFLERNLPLRLEEYYDPDDPVVISLDQFLYDLDEQICILRCSLYGDYELDEYDDVRDTLNYLEGQINSLEMIRSQFDGF